MELRIVDKETCIDKFPLDFRPYFTTDKICARPVKGVVCKGDGGGGVAFPTVDRQGIQRYYLRGVISTVPRNEHRCNVKSDMLLTHILKHENFIKTHLNKNFVSAPLGGCVLPDYPQHGTYTAHGKPDAVPGQVYDQIFLTITCDLGYGTVTTNTTFCVSDNKWSEPKPECSRFCQLTPHPSVEYYYCKDVGATSNNTRPCNEYEPSGTVAVSVCDRPNYYHPDDITDMHCDAGVWDHVTICQPECGIIKGVAGRDGHATLGEVPWHAGIYDKNIRKIICGGSLVSATVVISAASCFWSDLEGVKPPSKYMVALGKINLLWNEDMDTGVQRSNVSDITIPLQYQGAETFYKYDIAILVLATPVVYSGNIRPVCLNFSVDFDTSQLQGIDLGKAAGWGLTSENGEASPVLKNMELRIVDKKTCIKKFPLDFRSYFTTDKICARPVKGVVCKGDGGGGVAFPTVDRQGIQRYYLRGVISVKPRTELGCDVKTDFLLTYILEHENFIKTHLYPFRERL